jgi:tRNA(His) 5'-end guanylyltransferase
MHRKFPEYVNLKTKGQTFLLLSNQLDFKKPFHELKNKIGKL